ncbi:mandelate racemase/muconate lactonizing enzyme family protein [Gibbsiella dentisursi]|uniref:Mandelate racemase/muconate lactonizing enzyme family protein n=1 Tax=Gibbsiella dentisursi TaxID=796890 RepID=A0ABP7KYJ1_9GAMM
MKATLYRANVHYQALQLYTAASGSVTALEELYLLLEADGACGLGEVRVNIAYLNGYSPEQVLNDVMRALRRLDLSQSASTLLLTLETQLAGCLAPTRMLIDIALHDLFARQQGLSVAQLIGAQHPLPVSYSTNQTLFWAPDEQMLQQASAYVERGFTQLKLRIAVGSFTHDLKRIAALRDRFGDGISLSADANGQWRPDEALAKLQALAPFSLSYLEQPLADKDAHHYAALAAASPIPLMLDESMSNENDLERIIALRGQVWAHLKLVKMGGIAPVLRAAQRLQAANIPFMIGQMNEGGAATAAALHVAHACRPAYAELYGADGAADDPASGLRYSQGLVSSPNGAGLGIAFDPAQAQFIQEFNS